MHLSFEFAGGNSQVVLPNSKDECTKEISTSRIKKTRRSSPCMETTLELPPSKLLGNFLPANPKDECTKEISKLYGQKNSTLAQPSPSKLQLENSSSKLKRRIHKLDQKTRRSSPCTEYPPVNSKDECTKKK